MEHKSEESNSPHDLTGDVLIELRKALQERQKKSMQKPKVFLTPENLLPSRSFPEEKVNENKLPPLYVMDLQQLLLNGIQGNQASYKPRWCKILRITKVSSVMLIMIEGLSYTDYTENKSNFPYISELFSTYVEMVCPLQYSMTVDSELLKVPLSISHLKKVNIRVPKGIREMVSAKIYAPLKLPGEKLSRKCLLLSTYQMMSEGYPLPVYTQDEKYRDFVFSKEKYEPVTESSPLFALDCEMCLTSMNCSELTRVSIVSEDGQVIYDSLVKPKNKIINYLTRYSGITKELLDPVSTTLEDVQKEIRNILPPDAILCGQSLNCDLLALKIFHPYIIDTSIIFNLSGNRNMKTGLRKLTQFFFNRSIQDNIKGHCSTEDAIAVLDLVKLKLSKGIEFGDATLNGIYFPNIQTYFTGTDGSGKAVIENKEDEAVETISLFNKTPVSEIHISNDRTASTLTITDKKQKSSTTSSYSSSCEESDCEKTADEPRPKKVRLTESDNHTKCIKDGIDNSTGQVEQPVGDLYVPTSQNVKSQQKCLLGQEFSALVPHSFFYLVREAGRSACIIDRASVTEKFASEPIEKVTVTNDTEARQIAKDIVQSKEFVWTRFYDYVENNDMSSLSNKQKLQRKLDRRVNSVMKRVRPNALVALVFTGRENEDNTPNNMATFITTT